MAAQMRLILKIFVYIAVVCPLLVKKHISGEAVKIPALIKGNKRNAHITERPCPVCPGQGKCVPHIQCPSHLQGNNNRECHLQENQLGICCYKDTSRTANSDFYNEGLPTYSEDILRVARNRSNQKLIELISRNEVLFQDDNTIVKSWTPSYGHHLSLGTLDNSKATCGRDGLLQLFALQELRERDAWSEKELELTFNGPYCPPPITCPVSSPYRSLEGSCNNLAFPSWGAANTGYERILAPDFSDGVWALRTSVTGEPLPSARSISERLLLDSDYPSPTHNLAYMQFGQFLVHDVSSAVQFTHDNGSAISCCTKLGEKPLPPELQHFACAAIAVDPEDPFYRKFGRTCMNFVRLQLAPSPDCSLTYSKPMNGATHFIDLSNLYGNSGDKLASFRAPGGKLNTLNDYGRELPPVTDKDECASKINGGLCFQSGDKKGNMVITLTVFHVLWIREHNRVAEALTQLNPGWDEERVFWESRRILQAEFQNIVYQDWLPLLIGPQLMQIYGLVINSGYSSYEPDLNPALTTECFGAAMRFGHSTIDGKILVPDTKTGKICEMISTPEVMFQPFRLRLQPFLDRVVAGMTQQPMQLVDPFVSEAMTRYLFHGGEANGFDIGSLNIQRGRDVGIRSYNNYRKLIGLRPFTDFSEYPPSAANRLSSVYDSPEDVDLWVGALMEKPVPGGVVGPTFAHIIAEAFRRLKNGDRYFYSHRPEDNPGAFTPDQLAEIEKVTLSRIICDNVDGSHLTSHPVQAFLRSDLPHNPPVPCSSPLIPTMDLSRFKDV